MQITWHPSSHASAWYLATGIARGLFAESKDERVESVRSLVGELQTRLESVAQHVRLRHDAHVVLLDHLLADDCAGGGDPFLGIARSLAEWSVPPREGAEVESLLVAIGRDGETDAVRRNAELNLRAGPLRELWEARGPGLLRRLERQLGESFVFTATARVTLVQPFLGGGGRAWPSQPHVACEAALVNPWPALPEVARLAWLLAQHPAACAVESSGAVVTAIGRVTSATLIIPAVLEAAEYVELARCDRPTLLLALRAWAEFTEARPNTEALADWLTAWWDDARRRQLDWRSACRELTP